jgi:hypothetical protein
MGGVVTQQGLNSTRWPVNVAFVRSSREPESADPTRLPWIAFRSWGDTVATLGGSPSSRRGPRARVDIELGCEADIWSTGGRDATSLLGFRLQEKAAR